MITCVSMVPDIAKSMSSALDAKGSSNCEDDEINVGVGARNCGDKAKPATQVTLHHFFCEELYLIL
jgi:hypothetical protein